jgi:hypothetical protein
VTVFKYNQERLPLNTREAQKILILPVLLFQTGEYLSQVDINRPTNFCPSGAWTPWVVKHPDPRVHCRFDAQGFLISIICSWMEKVDIR